MRKSIGASLPLFVLVLTVCALSTSSPPTAAGGKRGGPPAPQAEPSGKAADLKAPAAGALIINPENSKIEFVGTKPDGKHDGGFKTFLGSITLPGDDVSAAKIT